ncbi:hypothetical protein [Telmatospirillum sp.]|uniref:hypothetical protein n=1 Tax=Telmatospirillum sp. TaxID=2079197 RepID=UPI00283BB76B|nr:hypothetical protein [Telmatospirillum sp.]MDR3437025.1 hypothetical protein [Telmatospirillum sp.]
MSDTMAQQQPAASAIGSGKPKTAVVVIHGMGEQRPMDTIRRFVAALWTHDTAITGKRDNAVYSKPDTITGNFELRRLSTRNVPLETGQPKRVDFFEFYWAHLMTGNRVEDVLGWLGDLLGRNPFSLPPRLVRYWFLATPLTLLGILTAVYSGAAVLFGDVLGALHLPAPSGGWAVSLSVLSLCFSYFVSRWIVPVAGDAARYLSPTPNNVEARQKIREAGVDLLGKLHASGRYDRIVLVGHSLGTVIGYDVLNYYWGRLDEAGLLAAHAEGSPTMAALTALENAAGQLLHAAVDQKGVLRAAYRRAQRTYQDTLRACPAGTAPLWAVTDFVTLGCPLSKGEVLIARNAAGFRERKAAREFPTCPPVLEKDGQKDRIFRFSFPLTKPSRIPHFAAVFGPVVWTNIYFDTVGMVFGDPIAGSVRESFGDGIRDIKIAAAPFTFRHTAYWDDAGSTQPWQRALRRAVNLKLLDETTLWGEQEMAPEVIADRLPTP